MSRLTEPAQYLLRIDDLCPTVDRERWKRLRELVQEFGIKPILAVVPDNRDPELKVSASDERLWDCLRGLQDEGAAIALHGFRHVCSSGCAGILPLSGSGEFAGVAIETQRRWIREGLAILRRERLEARLWIAPRHNFDGNTLRVLRDEGIGCLSDGLTRKPVVRGGVVWIPQQLWRPVEKRRGLWTICVHPNTVANGGFLELRNFFRDKAGQFTTFDRVLREFTLSPPNWMELLQERAEIFRIRLRRGLAPMRVGARSEQDRDAPSADRDREPPSYPGFA